MTNKELSDFCNEISSIYGYKLDIPVKLNGRLKRTLGRVLFKRYDKKCVPIRIEFSKNLIERGSFEDIKEVVLHELSHYFLMLDTGENHKHDKLWKRYAKKLGCKDRASININLNN